MLGRLLIRERGRSRVRVVVWEESTGPLPARGTAGGDHGGGRQPNRSLKKMENLMGNRTEAGR